MIDQNVDWAEVDRFKNQMAERDRHMEVIKQVAQTVDAITSGQRLDVKQVQAIFEEYFKEYGNWIRLNTKYARDVFFKELDLLTNERKQNGKAEGGTRLPEFRSAPINPDSIGDIFAWYFSQQLSANQTTEK